MIDFFTLMKLDNVKPDIKAPPKHITLLHSLFKAIFLISLLLIGHYWSFTMQIWQQLIFLLITFATFDLYETLCRII